MPIVHPINKLNTPALTDAPNVEAAFHPMATTIDSRLIPTFATVAERATKIKAPVIGQACVVTATGRTYKWNGSSWISFDFAPRVKPANQDQTSVGLFPDDFLFAAAEINSRYILKAEIYYQAPSTGDIQWQITGPTGSSVLTGYTVVAVSGSEGSQAITGGTIAGGGSAGSIGGGVIMFMHLRANIVTLATAGNITFNWGQASLSGTTTVLAGSLLQTFKYV